MSFDCKINSGRQYNHAVVNNSKESECLAAIPKSLIHSNLCAVPCSQTRSGKEFKSLKRIRDEPAPHGSVKVESTVIPFTAPVSDRMVLRPKRGAAPSFGTKPHVAPQMGYPPTCTTYDVTPWQKELTYFLSIGTRSQVAPTEFELSETDCAPRAKKFKPSVTVATSSNSSHLKVRPYDRFVLEREPLFHNVQIVWRTNHAQKAVVTTTHAGERFIDSLLN